MINGLSAGPIHQGGYYRFTYGITGLLNILSAVGKGVSKFQKPDKIFLENANFAYAINPNPDKGNVRETFLLSQLENTGEEVFAPVEGDFLTSGILMEVGGKSKDAKQVKAVESFLVAADDLEIGYGYKVPLWLFGFF